MQKLVPQKLTALQDLRGLQQISGVGGEVNVLVEGRSVTDPAVVAWMTRYQARILKRLRFDSRRGCGGSDICPAFSLPDLFTTKASVSSKARVDALLDAVPAVLLAERDHPGPAHRDARVRAEADAARAPVRRAADDAARARPAGRA